MRSVNERIGHRVKQMRELRGYTQSQLAYLVSEKQVNQKPSQSTISCWQHGTQPIPSDALIAIMQCLQCSPYAIMGDMSPCDSKEQQLHNAVHHLPMKDKRSLLYLMQIWLGDVHCLIQCGLMYSCLPQKVRKVAARHCLKLYQGNREQLSVYSQYVDQLKVYKGAMMLGKGYASLDRQKNRKTKVFQLSEDEG